MEKIILDAETPYEIYVTIEADIIYVDTPFECHLQYSIVEDRIILNTFDDDYVYNLFKLWFECNKLYFKDIFKNLDNIVYLADIEEQYEGSVDL